MASICGLNKATGHDVGCFLRHHWHVFGYPWHGALLDFDWRNDWHLDASQRCFCGQLLD